MRRPGCPLGQHQPTEHKRQHSGATMNNDIPTHDLLPLISDVLLYLLPFISTANAAHSCPRYSVNVIQPWASVSFHSRHI